MKVPEVLQPFLRIQVQDKLPLAPMFDFRPQQIRRWSKKLCAEAGLHYVCAHGLRGTHITLALDEGESALAVARSVGHADVRTTTGVYARPGAGGDVRTEKLAKLMTRKEEDPGVAAPGSSMLPKKCPKTPLGGDRGSENAL